MKKKATFFLLFITFIILYFALIYTGLESGDYILYSYKFSMTPQEGAPWPLVHEKIANFKDIVYSQYVHYLFVNGRSLVHTVIQIFTSFVRYDICCLIATFVYALTLVLGVKVCFHRDYFTWEPLFVYIAAVFAFCCDPAAIYSMVTAINYLWPITLCLMFIVMIRQHLNQAMKCLFFLVAFISGWSHEAIAIPLSAAFIIFLYNERKKLLPYQVIGILLLFAGTAITIAAPGNFTKFLNAQESPSTIILIKQHLYMIVYLRLFYILVIALTFLACRHKLMAFILKYQYWFIALAASFFFILMTGPINPRSTFFIDIISGGILCLLINNYTKTVSRLHLITFLSIIIIPLYSSAIHYRSITKDRMQKAEKNIATSNESIVNIDIKQVKVPYIIKPFVKSSTPAQKQLPIYWNSAVYQFAYQKEKVNISFVDSE